MFAHDRHRAILERLARKPRWAVTQLQREMRISRSTLRRDLLELEDRGDVVRVHGGVVHRDYLQGEPTFDKRGKEAVDAKRAIAAAAAARVAENSVVYLDAGTTCAEIARRVLLRSDVTIYTHSLRLAADAASSNSPATVVLIGGEVRNVSQAVVGALSLNWLSHLKFDLAFVAASGMDIEGPSTTELSEAAIKGAIIARSKHSVLVADAGKWERSAPVRFATWQQLSTWVVDSNLSKGVRDALKRRGVDVVLAKGQENAE